MENHGLEIKYEKLKEDLKNYRKVLIAFSGGVDSTFLIKVAHDVLNGGATAVTAASESMPSDELEFSKKIASEIGIKHVVIESSEMKNKNYVKNPDNRCYYCKKDLFAHLKNLAVKDKIKNILYAANLDDLGDYRPGSCAAKEFNVRSPLVDAGLTKTDIRTLSKKLGLPTWNKPSSPCLSSRIPYGQKITKKKLKMVEEAEKLLKDIGLKEVRVRIHGKIAKIEIPKKNIQAFTNQKLSDELIKKFKDLGFNYVTLDLEGYRSGSLNEVLDEKRIRPSK